FQVVQPLVLRGTADELTRMEGPALRSVTRRGKFLTFDFGANRLVMNPMLTGRLGLGVPGTKPLANTALVLTFGPRGDVGPRTFVEPVAGWTKSAPWLPADEQPVELRYRDPTRMGKVYVVPDGVARPIAGWDEQGPDTDDPSLDLETWRGRI